jgi:hypothetical protein
MNFGVFCCADAGLNAGASPPLCSYARRKALCSATATCRLGLHASWREANAAVVAAPALPSVETGNFARFGHSVEPHSPRITRNVSSLA